MPLGPSSHWIFQARCHAQSRSDGARKERGLKVDVRSNPVVNEVKTERASKIPTSKVFQEKRKTWVTTKKFVRIQKCFKHPPALTKEGDHRKNGRSWAYEHLLNNQEILPKAVLQKRGSEHPLLGELGFQSASPSKTSFLYGHTQRMSWFLSMGSRKPRFYTSKNAVLRCLVTKTITFYKCSQQSIYQHIRKYSDKLCKLIVKIN